MGGPGSGRLAGGRPVLEDLHELDVRLLRRRGLLEPGRVFPFVWPRLGGWGRGAGRAAALAVVAVEVGGGAVHLCCDAPPGWTAAGGRTPGARLAVWERVPLPRTAQRLGGERAWFGCPGCGLRCAVLYLLPPFRCRRCAGLPYASQGENACLRLIERAHRIRARVAGEEACGGLHTPFPPRPRRMRPATYARLRAEASACRRAAWCSALGLPAEEDDG